MAINWGRLRFRVTDEEDAELVEVTEISGLPVRLFNKNGNQELALSSSSFSAKLNLVRPANTTAYTALDVVGQSSGATLKFPNMAPVGGGYVMITTVTFKVDVTSVPAGMGNFLLYLYEEAPASALADNAAWDIAANDRPGFLGQIRLSTPIDLGSSLYIEANGINKHIKLPSSNLYVYLVTEGGFTPAAASEVYALTLYSIAL